MSLKQIIGNTLPLSSNQIKSITSWQKGEFPVCDVLGRHQIHTRLALRHLCYYLFRGCRSNYYLLNGVACRGKSSSLQAAVVEKKGRKNPPPPFFCESKDTAGRRLDFRPFWAPSPSHKSRRVALSFFPLVPTCSCKYQGRSTNRIEKKQKKIRGDDFFVVFMDAEMNGNGKVCIDASGSPQFF